MPSKLFAPITIIHYPGPSGGHSIKHTYYFKAISGLVGQAGLEPAMLKSAWFTVRWGCQFSYWPIWWTRRVSNPQTPAWRAGGSIQICLRVQTKIPGALVRTSGDYRNILGTHYPWRWPISWIRLSLWAHEDNTQSLSLNLCSFIMQYGRESIDFSMVLLLR